MGEYQISEILIVNTYQYGPQKVEGSYLYYDSDNDNRFETIFVVDQYNNVLGVGFDYDGNGYFLPNKMNLVKNQVELTENSAEHKNDIYNILTYALDNPYGNLLRFNESRNDHRLEPTLSDSMFEIWKIAYDGSSSKLLEEVSNKKANEFIENVWNKRLGEDILWQVEAQAMAIIGAAIGAGIGSIFPGLGNVAGAKIGYILTYATVNIIRSLNQQRDLDNYIAHQSFYNTNFKGAQTLSSKWWMDTWFGDLPTNALFGSSQGVYAPIKRQTALYEYTGEVILAPSGIEKTDTLLGDSFKPLILDYSLQAKNLVAYSDFDNWMLEAFLQKRDGFGWNTDPTFMHSENSIIYLEDQVSSAITQNEDILLDSIMPYMVYSVPTLEFTDSQGGISQPEFYETHPIYVSAENYEQVKNEYNSIYKISDLETPELQLIPKASVHYLHSEVISIEVYLVWSITNPLYSADYSYIRTLEAEDFEFDPLTGSLLINDNTTTELKAKLKIKQEKYPEKELALCFKVHIEKYRSIEDLRELSREEVDQIVTMQTTHANVLEYYYQFNLGSKQEEQLQELAYTAVVTAISTAISIGVSFGIGKIVRLANKYLGSLVNLPDLAGITGIQSVPKVQQFLHGFSTYLMQASVSLSGFSIAVACIKEISQEIFIDPLVETFVSNLVREMGYDATIQMIASTLAESLREEFSGQISGIFKGSQSEFTFQNYMDKRLTIDNQYPIGQELIQYFNQYKAELTTSQDKKDNLRLLGTLGTPMKLFTSAVSVYSLNKLANSKRLSNLLKWSGIGAGILVASATVGSLSAIYGFYGLITGLGVVTPAFFVMITTTIQNTQKKEHLKRLVQEQLAHFEETGEQKHSLSTVSNLINYQDRTRIRNTILEMLSRETYNRIFNTRFRKNAITEQKLIEKVKEIGLRKSGREGIVTENGIKMFRQAQQGKISPSKARVELFCQIEGHSPWETVVGNVFKDIWCKKCADQGRIFTWADAFERGLTENPSMVFYLKETPDTFVDKIKNRPEGITPSKVKLNWECEEGHKISKGYGEIQYKGCKHCYRIGQSITYQYAKEVAIAKGYKLVTTPSQFKKLMEQAYKNKVKPNMAKLKYSCGKHTWYASHRLMKMKTSRCPKCDSGYYETRTRKNFKQVFGFVFEKISMKTVLNKRGIHGGSHYDGYATFFVAGRKVKIAFEYNGEQHYQFPNSYYRSYREWIESIKRDERKILDSQAEGVILITIPYHFYQKAGADTYIQKFIISQFEQQVRSIFGLPGFTFNRKALSPDSTLLNFIGKKP